MEKSKPFTFSEVCWLVMLSLCAAIVLFALAGVDLIHPVGNLIRWLRWA
jgi:hypothetical protein